MGNSVYDYDFLKFRPSTGGGYWAYLCCIPKSLDMPLVLIQKCHFIIFILQHHLVFHSWCFWMLSL